MGLVFLRLHPFGSLPQSMEFMGNIEADYLEDFLRTAQRMRKHKNINPALFAFLRVHVAFKEDYKFCKIFNTQLLLAQGYAQEQLDAVVKSVTSVPFDDKHQALAKHALQAIYTGENITQNDFDSLYKMGWTQRDVFDAIEHTGTIFRNGRILRAYSKKD